jgi:hypothetical protein
MKHRTIRLVAIGLCCGLLSTVPALGQVAKAPSEETFLIPPMQVMPALKVTSVELDGSIRLEPVAERAQMQIPWWPITEGHYLIIQAMGPGPMSAGTRKMSSSLVHAEVVEVGKGTTIKAKAGPDAIKALKAGDVVMLVRPGQMTTAQIRDLPTLIPIGRERQEKKYEGLIEAAERARQAARLAQSVNNLKQIGLAMHNFHSVNDCFPPAVVYGPDGKPWHSWRILIVPFLENGVELYNQYDFTQPWDSPKNMALMDKMPAVYRDPLSGETTGSVTGYVALVGEKTVFSPKGSKIKIANGAASEDLFKGTSIASITDGTSNTIMVVPADPAKKIPWMKPDDLPVGANFPGLGQPGGIDTPARIDGVGVAPILFCDGSVKTLSDKTKPATIFSLTTMAGGEIFSSDMLISPANLRGPGPNQMPTLHLFRSGGKVTAIIE